MKQALLIAFSCIALMFAVPATAGEFDVFGSYMSTDDFDDSWGAGIRTGWQFGMSPLGMEVRASYFPELGTDLDDLVDEIDAPGDFFDQQDVEAIPLDLGVTFKIADTVHVGGGVSYVMLDSDFGDLDDETGFYGVVGFRTARAEGVGFFVEGLYRTIEASVDPDDFDDVDDPDDVPDLFTDDVAIDLDGFTVNAGVTFRW